MKREIPSALKGGFAVSLAFAILLFLLQCALATALALEGFLSRFSPANGDARLLWGTLACMALNGYVLARSVKARHFLGLFGEWPGLAEEASEDRETRLLATSARQAFFLADYERCLGFLRRLGAAGAQASLAHGRALALAGRFDEARLALEEAGQSWTAKRYLAHRSFLWFDARSYFSGLDLRFATEAWRLPLLGLLSLAVCVPLLAVDAGSFEDVWSARTADFSEMDFKVSVQGPFTLHYHDEAFMLQVAEVAQAALDQSLDFLGLPKDSFAPGQIQLFLCKDQAEYLARSPFTKSWEAASAMPSKHQIYLYRFPDNQRSFFEVVLAHELTHLCYHRLVPEGRSDSWLNEGLADYLGYKFGLARAHFPQQAWLMANVFNGLKKDALPFEAFLSEDPQTISDTRTINLFYVQGFSIVDVLIEQYGREPFLHFLRVFGTGKSLPEALASCYPTIRTVTDLQAVWQLFMR